MSNQKDAQAAAARALAAREETDTLIAEGFEPIDTEGFEPISHRIAYEIPAGSVDLVNDMTDEQLRALVSPVLIPALPAIAWTVIAYAVDQFLLEGQVFLFPTDQTWVVEEMPEIAAQIQDAAMRAAVSGLPTDHGFRRHCERLIAEDQPRYRILHNEEIA